MSRDRGAAQRGKPSHNPRWGALLRRQRFALALRELGTLYGGVECDEADARELRDECEQSGGVPMGYGRVQREPIQLSDEAARAQFRARNVKP